MRNYRNRINAVMVKKISKEKKPWRIVGERKTEYAYEFAYLVPSGYSVDDIEKNIAAFNAACGAEMEVVDRKGVVILKVYTSDFPKIVKFQQESLKKDSVLLGFDRSRKPVYHSFKTNPHLMIAGMSGYGKTDLLRLIIYQFLFVPNIEILIVDMKGFSFLPFFDVPQIKEVARDLPTAQRLLQYAVKEMVHREEMVWENRNRSIVESFHPIVVIIDEAAQISPRLQKDKHLKKIAELCDEACAKIATKGREPKVSLLYCTQRPDHEVINGQVKANMDCSIALRTKNEVNSRIILDRTGAERLPQNIPGRAIYSATTDTVIQIPYVGNDDTWKKLLAGLKTEVLSHGQSERKTKEPYIVDVSDDSPSDNRTNREIDFPRKWFAGETSERNVKGIGTRKDPRGAQTWNNEKNMEALPPRPSASRGREYTDSVEYDKIKSLFSDW